MRGDIVNKVISLTIIIALICSPLSIAGGAWTRSSTCKDNCDNALKNIAELKTERNCSDIAKNNNDEYQATLPTEEDKAQFGLNVSCCDSLNNYLGTIDGYCSAAGLKEETSKRYDPIIKGYTAAAAVCLAACATAWGTDNVAKSSLASSITGLGCGAAGAIATVVEFVQKEELQKIVGKQQIIMAEIGALVGAAGGTVSSLVNFGPKSWEAGRLEWNKEGYDTAASCISAVIFAGIATQRWTSFNQINGDSECDQIANLQTESTDKITLLATLCPDLGDELVDPIFSTAGSLQNSKVYAPDPNTSSPTDQEKYDDNEDADLDMSKIGSMAAKDPLGGKLFRDVIDQDKLEDALNKIGLPMSKLAKKLESSSPASALGGMGGLTPGLKKALQEIDDNVKKLSTQAGTNSVYSTPGGGKKNAAGANLGFGAGFGQKDQAGANSKDMAFTVIDKRELASSDIWHSNCIECSIFDIVSDRYTKSKDRVEKLDWASRLNKAYFWGSEKKK